MPDPRIERTRSHVIETVRKLLERREEVTFSLVASEAKVSRRTLYVHWGTVEELIWDAVRTVNPRKPDDLDEMTPREMLRYMLYRVREESRNPLAGAALANAARAHTGTGEGNPGTLEMVDERRMRYAAVIGEITREQFSLLYGPIIFTEIFMSSHLSDDFIEATVERAIDMLGLRDRADIPVKVPPAPEPPKKL